MEHFTARILPRSSDVIVIIRLADGTILDLNGACIAATGNRRHDLLGRPADELLAGMGATADALQELGDLTDVPVGLWTRPGDLLVGGLSSLALEIEGQPVAFCTIREVRTPSPVERRSAARAALDRLVLTGASGPELAPMALQAFGRCLRWELGVLWQGAAGPEDLRCTAVWRGPRAGLERLEEMTRNAAFPPGLEMVGRAWLRGESTWVPDASVDPGFLRSRGRAGQSARGWLGFPVWGPDQVIGAAEFLSQDRRPPDEGLQATLDEFGRLFGRLYEDVQAPGGRRLDEAATPSPTTRETPSATVSGAFRDLAGAVAAATEALERHPDVPSQVEPPALLGELTDGIGKLNRLLQDATDRPVNAAAAPRPWAPSPGPPRELPTGLTLKAVSRRTGIPAATLRTWQRRYGFMRPERSPSGYRLYGEEEIARIEQVKYLVEQGVRIGAAMNAVIHATEGPEDGGRARPAG
jgi:MerR HTH family regulatory protein